MGFRKAASKDTGGKFLILGDTNSGKSWFTLTFPDVAAIDSETGLTHYEGREIEINGKKYNNLKLVDNTADLDTLEEDLDDFLDGMYDGQIKTLTIDSETKFYNTMQVTAMKVEERRAQEKGDDVNDQTVSQRQWGRIKLVNMKMQQAKIDLSARGIHIVSVAQATDERDKKKPDKIIGVKPDMHKSAKFDYDTILEFYTELDPKTNEVRFYAVVKKDRTLVTKVGDVIENCTFDIWADYYQSLSGKEKMTVNYTKDLKTSEDSMQSDADKAGELSQEFKSILAKLGKDKVANKDEIIAIKTKMKELDINSKQLDVNPTDKLEELVEFARTQYPQE